MRPPAASSLATALAFDPDAGRAARFAWAGLVLTLAASMFSIAIAQAVFLVGAVAWFGTWRTWSGDWRATVALHAPFIVFALFRILSVLVSTRPDLSTAALHREIAFYLMYPMAVSLLSRRTSERLDLVFRILFWAGTAAAIVGIVRYGAGAVPRAASFSAGYYTLGAFLSLGIVATAALWRARSVFPRAWVALAGMAVMGAGLLVTFNRMHWIATAVALAVVGLRRERRLALGAVIVAAAFFVLAPKVRDRAASLTNVAENSSGRTVIFRGAWMLAGDHPLTGFGPRTFREIFPLWGELDDKGVANWHNDFVQTYLESGIVALLAYMALFAQALVLLWRIVRRPRDAAEGGPHGEALLAMVIVFAISGCTYDSLPAFWFRLMLAAVICLYGAEVRGGIDRGKSVSLRDD